jgi:hypothetical protein
VGADRRAAKIGFVGGVFGAPQRGKGRPPAMATQSVTTQEPRSTERAAISEKTLRTDRWWLLPLVTFIGFTAFIVYSTWAAFDHHSYYVNPYLSPFYSPCLAKSCPPGVAWVHWNIGNWISPALIVLIFPLSFRATCYYYRKAYYRSFWLSPPACAVAEPHQKYTGETRFPLVAQNIHRYAWYFAAIFAGILSYDAVTSFIYKDAAGGHHFFIGVGSFIFVINALLILGYTFGCHSCRHITAGRINNFSKHPLRYKWWSFVSWLNKHHIRWAWSSLVWVALVDLYVRLVASGNLHDYHHIFGAVH